MKEPEAGGVMILSGNQLYSTVSDTSGRDRSCIDFRTLNIDDVVTGTEAPNLDSECTGTSLRDFLRAGEREPMPKMLLSPTKG